MITLIASLLFGFYQNSESPQNAFDPTLSELVSEFDFLYGFHTSTEGELSEFHNSQFRHYLSWKFLDLLEVAEQTTELEPYTFEAFCRIVNVSARIDIPSGAAPVSVQATLQRVYVENSLDDEATGSAYCYELRDRFQ